MITLFDDNNTALGIPLQIGDIFLPELCKVDGQNISFEDLAHLLKPFIHTLATTKMGLLKERIREKVFDILLESNASIPSESDESSSEEDLTKVDGGKMSKRTRKDVMKLINTKYVFPNFNVLLYAENFIFPTASAPAISSDNSSSLIISEDNREQVYDLYYKAL